MTITDPECPHWIVFDLGPDKPFCDWCHKDFTPEEADILMLGPQEQLYAEIEKQLGHNPDPRKKESS